MSEGNYSSGDGLPSRLQNLPLQAAYNELSRTLHLEALWKTLKKTPKKILKMSTRN